MRKRHRKKAIQKHRQGRPLTVREREYIESLGDSLCLVGRIKEWFQIIGRVIKETVDNICAMTEEELLARIDETGATEKEKRAMLAWATLIRLKRGLTGDGLE